MFGQAWLTYLRSSLRQPLFAALNLGGLALGLAVALILITAIRTDLTYNRWITDPGQVHRLNLTILGEGGSGVTSDTTPGVIAPLLAADAREITAFTRIHRADVTVTVDGRTTREQLDLVDPDFFSVFPYPARTGDGAAALQAPNGLVLDEQTARRLTGDADPVGRLVTVTIGKVRQNFEIRAVLQDYPPGTTVRPGLLAQLRPTLFDEATRERLFARWGSSTVQTWVRMAQPGGGASLAGQLDGFMQRRASDVPADLFKLTLTALPDVHLADGSRMMRSSTGGANPLLLASLGIVAALALVISIVNYTNLATARAVLRAREVAVRKAIGADRRQIAAQLMAEALVTALLAGILGIMLAELLLPLLNGLLGTRLDLSYFGLWGAFSVAGVLSVLAGVLAGAYPALVMSRFAPAAVLAAGAAPVKGRGLRRFREALVGLQFVAAVGLATAALVMLTQADHVARLDPGFARDRLLLVREIGDPQLDARRSSVLQAIRSVPGVEAVGLSSRSPAGRNTLSVSAARPGFVGEPPSVVLEQLGPGAAEALGLRLLAGRLLSERLGSDLAPVDGEALLQAGQGVMINLATVMALGFDGPEIAMGQPVRVDGVDATITGVVADVRFNDPRELVPPVVYTLSTGLIPGPVLFVRTTAAPDEGLERRVQQVWAGIAPDVPMTLQSARAALRDLTGPDRRRGQLFAGGALAALLIGAIGLFGLSAFIVSRRQREIGIRKALGAQSRQVFAQVLLQFLRPILIAIPVGWLAGWFAVLPWRAQFVDQVPPAPDLFLLPAAGAVTLALATVLWQAAILARSIPAQALRQP